MVQRNDLSGRLTEFSKSGISSSTLSPKAMARRRRMAMLSMAAASVVLTAGTSKTQATPVTGFGNENVSFGSDSITVSGLTAGTNTASIASANANAIMNAMNSANAAGGGTVTIPSGTYYSSEILLKSSMDNVDLVLSSGTVLTTNAPGTTFITNSGTVKNFALTGSGAINGGATGGGNSSTKIVAILGGTNLLFKGITIENADGVHFAPEQDTNVTIAGININDNGELAASSTHGYIGNTDGIDYDGNNFLIENSSIQDGDDDIVDKTNSNGTHGVLIQNDWIGAGHGIGVGGGFQGGIDNYTVNNITFNGTTTGLRIKADTLTSGDTGGGASHPASATYENIVMTNVQMPIEFDSFYSGGENLPSSPVPGVSSGATHSSNTTNNDQYPTGGVSITSSTPVFSNVLFMNITSIDSQSNSFAGSIFGQNVSGGNFNVANVTFYNVQLTAERQLDVWYSGGLTFGGVVVNNGTPGAGNAPFTGYTNSLNTGPTNIANIYFYGDQIITTVPEPTSLALAIPALAGLAGSRMVGRRRRKAQA
jgi:polygalacturonase